MATLVAGFTTLCVTVIDKTYSVSYPYEVFKINISCSWELNGWWISVLLKLSYAGSMKHKAYSRTYLWFPINTRSDILSILAGGFKPLGLKEKTCILRLCEWIQLISGTVAFLFQEEAYALWKSQWRKLYEEGSRSWNVIDEMCNTFFLVNLVDNDFINGNAIYEVLSRVLGYQDETRADSIEVSSTMQ